MVTTTSVQPLSEKQTQSLCEARARLNVWHGAVRSGKTFASLWAWLDHIIHGPQGPLLMIGKTERTLIRNAVAPLQAILGDKLCHLRRGEGTVNILGRTVYLAGANDERAEEKIRGLTLAGAYGDELTTWPESMFRMLLSRLSLEGARLYGTTNPDSPFHYLNTDFITNEDIDIASWQFTIYDNPYLPPEFISSLEMEYPGLWKHRYIDGKWIQAEGVVYDMFDMDSHVIDDLPDMRRYWMAIDYGSTHPAVALLMGEGLYDRKLYIAHEWRWDSKAKGRAITQSELSQRLKDWLAGLNIRPEVIWYDPSEPSLATQMWQDGFKPVHKANNDVIPGIRNVSTLLSRNLLLIHRSCEGLIAEMTTYSWDPAAQKRGEDKPIKQADDAADVCRYLIQGTKHRWRRNHRIPSHGDDEEERGNGRKAA